MGDRDQKTSKVETVPMNPVVERQTDALRRVMDALASARATGVPVDRETVDNFLGDSFPRRAPSTKARDIEGILDGAIDRIEARARGKEKPVATPFRLWNEALAGGFWPGVHFLVGSTGVGKTVLTTQIALGAAREKHVVAIAPIELGAEQTAIRLLGEASEVPWSKLMTGDKVEMSKVREAKEELAKLPIIVDDYDPNGWAPSKLNALCELAGAKAQELEHPTTENPFGEPDESPKRAPLIIVDFAQIMGNEEDGRLDIRERIANAMYAARAYSQTHQCAVLMVSSVARSGYQVTWGNSGKLKEAGVRFSIDGVRGETASYDLTGAGSLVGLGKESGELEYSASSVSVMVRTPTGGGMALAIAKNRFGKASWVPLIFAGDGSGYREALEHEAEAIAQAFRGEKDKVDTSKVVKNEAKTKKVAPPQP